MKRKKEIPLALSEETLPRFREAVAKIEASRQNKNGQVLDVKLGQDQQGNEIGIIVIEEEL